MAQSAIVVDFAQKRTRLSTAGMGPGILVGNGVLAADLPRLRREFTGLQEVAFADLSLEMLLRLRPSLVVGHLLAPDYDGIELSQLIASSGRQTKTYLLAKGLPRPELVEHELRAIFPSLGLELLSIPRDFF